MRAARMSIGFPRTGCLWRVHFQLTVAQTFLSVSVTDKNVCVTNQSNHDDKRVRDKRRSDFVAGMHESDHQTEDGQSQDGH
jgi:hypothetical protein